MLSLLCKVVLVAEKVKKALVSGHVQFLIELWYFGRYYIVSSPGNFIVARHEEDCCECSY